MTRSTARRTARSAIGRVAALLSVLLGACAADPPLVPPVELTPIEPSLALARRWSATAGDAGQGRFEPYVNARRVVVADENGVISAFDRVSGRGLWRRDLDTSLSSGVGGDVGSGAGGEEEGDRNGEGGMPLFVASTDGVVYALEPETGDTLWTATMSSEVLVAPVSAFGAVLVRSVDGRIVALEPDDGRERWSVSNAPPALTLTGYGRPFIVDGGALVGLDDGRVLALGLDNGRTIWESVISVPSGRSEVERLVDIDADLGVDDEGIYVVNFQGRVARLEPARGQVVWSVPMSSTAGLVLAGDRLVVIDEEDGLHALGRDDGRLLWSSEALRGRRLSPPALLPGGEAIAVGDFEGHVHLLSLADGALVGRSRVKDARLAARPVIDDNQIFVLDREGRLSAHELVVR